MASKSILQELQSCRNVAELKSIHSRLIQTGSISTFFVLNTLIIFYNRYSSAIDALHVFEEMPRRNVVSWTATVSAFVQNQEYQKALNLYLRMKSTGTVQPNKFTFASILPAFAAFASFDKASQIHCDIVKSGLASNVFVASALLDVYIKSGNLDFAQRVFDKMPERSTVSWNSMIAGYAQNGLLDKASRVFKTMPDRNTVSWNTLIAGYADSGMVDDALRLFEQCPCKDLVSWTSIINACCQNGYSYQALQLFRQMQDQQHQIGPGNSFTVAALLQACANLGDSALGKQIHTRVLRCGMNSNVFALSALVYMYGKCSLLLDAQQVFERMSELNNVSWNAIITAYTHNGHLDKAQSLFNSLPIKTTVAWNALIAGYAASGMFQKALEMFQEMRKAELKPNAGTFASILPAFSYQASLALGKQVHEMIVRSGFERDVFVGSALIDMYAKCGSLNDSEKVFHKFWHKDLVMWTSMAVAYALHGNAEQAIRVFQEMEGKAGLRPSPVIFTAILTACCHAGLVSHGLYYFQRMTVHYQLRPTTEHYCCMVHLLGLSGRLQEALEFIERMPEQVKEEGGVWRSLLAACHLHGHVELGQKIATHLWKLDSNKSASYVLLSNIYAGAGKWEDIAKLRKEMKEKGVSKVPGCSWIEVNNKVYSFVAGMV